MSRRILKWTIDEVLGSAVVADGALVWHVVRRPA